MSEYNTPQDQGPLPPDEVPASPLPSPMDITDEEDQINPRCSKTAISQPTRTEPATLPARSSKHPGTEALASPGPSPMEISEQGNRRSARLREKCEASKTKERTVARNTKPKVCSLDCTFRPMENALIDFVLRANHHVPRESELASQSSTRSWSQTGR